MQAIRSDQQRGGVHGPVRPAGSEGSLAYTHAQLRRSAAGGEIALEPRVRWGRVIGPQREDGVRGEAGRHYPHRDLDRLLALVARTAGS